VTAASSPPVPDQPTPPSVEAARLERALFEIKRVIVGQDRLVERMLVGLLARGHVLLEGVPGVAKTLAVETLATVVGGKFARLQFTPDLVPADIIGTRIYKSGQDAFDTELGPVFANFVLADEINRAPAKVQSALLEVMAERQVSIGGVTHPLPDPFLVLATQNPIESEGVYQLPEAQRDRFLLKVLVDYPSPEEEREIIYRMGSTPPEAQTVLGPDDVRRLQRTASEVFVHHALVDYVVRLVVATRAPREHGMEDVAGWVSYGASPRASLGLIAASRALALIRGRDYVLPQDVLDVTADVLRHRLVLSYDALADGVPADHIVKRVVQSVPLPQVTPRQRSGGYGPGSPGGPVVPGFGGGAFGPPNGQPGQFGQPFGQPQGQPGPIGQPPFGQPPFGQPQGQPAQFGQYQPQPYGQPNGQPATGSTAASTGDRPDGGPGPQPV
jgi:MoxR-like ATPase